MFNFKDSFLHFFKFFILNPFFFFFFFLDVVKMALQGHAARMAKPMAKLMTAGNKKTAQSGKCTLFFWPLLDKD